MSKYSSPSMELVGGTNSSAQPFSLIKMGYAVLVGAGVALLAAAGAAAVVVYGATWLWCDPYW